MESSTHDSLNPFPDNLPNRLTLFRLVLVPIIFFFLFFSHEESYILSDLSDELSLIASLLFTIASITDWLDGYIARNRNLTTTFGSFLDPIADKFLVVTSLVVLLSLEKLPSAVVLVLILREMYMTSLRQWAQTHEVDIPVDRWGKWKTATQMLGLPLLMLNSSYLGVPWSIAGLSLVYVASFLSIYSAFGYSVKMIKELRLKKLAKKKNLEVNQ